MAERVNLFILVIYNSGRIGVGGILQLALREKYHCSVKRNFCEAESILFLTIRLKFSYIQYVHLEAEPHFSSVASQKEHPF